MVAALVGACAYGASGRQGGPPPGAARRAAGGPIDTLNLKAHSYFLAHDRLMGRGTGTAGAAVAALYIAASCRALGLEPLGDDFLQPVPLVEVTITAGTVAMEGSGFQDSFSFPRHFVPDLGAAGTFDGFSGPVVYLNTPIVPEALPDLHGAVVAVLGPAGERASLAVLAERGAVGVIQLGAEPELFLVYSRSRGLVRMHHAEPGIEASLPSPLPLIIAGPELTGTVLEGTPLAAGQPMRNGSLGRYAELRLQTERRTITDHNVGCVLPGADARARDTAIAYTAHYDHLGVGLPDEHGDSTYNGFSDNAAGVAMVLGIAASMRRAMPRLRHSILFIFFTGEERGLLGSDYYVAHPRWPLSRTRAVINLDAGAPAAPPTSWRIAGGTGLDFGLLAIDVALERGWSATTSPPRANSDYYPFTRHGVPAVSLIPGPGPYEGIGVDSSEALRRRWDLYHNPGDEWRPDFPFAGLQRYAVYAYYIGLAADGRQGEAGPERSRRRY